MHDVVHAIGGLLALLSAVAVALAQTSTARAADAFSPIAGRLLVAAPVNINGPFSEEVQQLGRGEVVLLQIRYPVAPPMPEGVSVASPGKTVELVVVAKTSSEVAVLAREPKSGGLIGISFVQVILRGAKPGKDLVMVRVKRGDGSVKDVPFSFEVK